MPTENTRVTVLLFARAKELANGGQVVLQLPSPPTIQAVRSSLVAQVPELAALLPGCRFAVNDAFATEDQIVGPDDEVALIPPVSGG